MSTAQSTLEILVKLKDNTKSSFGSLSASLEGLGGVAEKAGIALAGIGVAAGTGLAFAVKAAAEAQVDMAKLDTTLKNMGESAMKNKDALLEAAGAATKLGFDDEEAALSIANLYQRTGDLSKATQLNTLAMDLARQKGISLAESSNLIGMVMSGNGRALKQYGIEISDSLTPMQALDELQKKVGGNAEAFGKTFTGQVEILKVAFGNMMEAIGDKVLPILTELAIKYVPVVIEAFDRFANALGRMGEIVSQYLPSWEQFKGWIDSVKTGVIDFISLTAPLWDVLKSSLNDLFLVVKFNLWPSIQELFEALKPLVPIVGVALYLAFITFVEVLTAVASILSTLIGWIASIVKWLTGAMIAAVDIAKGAWKGFTETLTAVVDALKSVYEWGKKAYDTAKSALGLKSGGKEKKVDDAVISPSGDVVSTNPKDWLIATQNPALLGGGGGSVFNINLNGDLFTDDQTATRFADSIARGIKTQLNLGGIRV